MAWKMPKKINVLGHEFTVQLVELKGAYGDTNVYERTIRIDPRYPKAKQREILTHEVLHAVIGIAGADHLVTEKTEEAIVWACQHGIHPLIVKGIL